MARSATYIPDMVAVGVLDKKVVEGAAEEIASERAPGEHAVALSEVADQIDASGRCEESAVVRLLASRSCDPVKILETLVERGEVTLRQLRTAAE